MAHTPSNPVAAGVLEFEGMQLTSLQVAINFLAEALAQSALNNLPISLNVCHASLGVPLNVCRAGATTWSRSVFGDVNDVIVSVT